MSEPYEAIELRVEGDGVAILTLNRPEAMNAWNARMAAEIDHALRACDADDAVRALVVTGAGRAFCAGADLGRGGDTFRPAQSAAGTKARADAKPAARGAAGPAAEASAAAEAKPAAERRRGPFPEAFWPFMMRKPVIAALNGHAIGVGITFPMTCDVRYVAEDAKIQFAFVRRGVIPELASHTIVPRVVGLSRAADLLLTGRIISGREAAALGLASRALPRDEVLPAALAHAREFRLAAPVSVALSKRLLWEGLGVSAPEMMRREAPLFAWVGGQPDAREGVLAFLEKREPAWKLRPSRDLPER